jgi:hypothetical protein
MGEWAAVLANRGWDPVEPGRLTLTPKWFSGKAWGGPARCEVEVGGDELALWDMLGWLRFGVTVTNPAGRAVWAGIVLEVQVSLGAVTVGLALDRVTNRVAAAYTYTDANNRQVRGTTSWAQDDASVSTYGVRELMLSLADSNQTQAEAARTTELTRRGRPVMQLGMEEMVGGRLVCCGLWETLGWMHYANGSGREMHDAAPDVEHMLGWGVGASARFAFREERIDDIDARLGLLVTDHQIRVSGASNAGNNGVKRVSSPASGGQSVYAATTISFDPADDIRDSANGLGFLRTDVAVLVAGASNAGNNGSFWTKSAGAGAVEVTPGASIVSESAGANVTLTQGHGASFVESFVTERTGASVTLTSVGTRLAQKFILGSAMGWTVREALISVRKVGAPADNLTVKICADSAGNPGTVLATATVAAAAVGTEAAWVSFDFGAGVALSTGTSYWVVVDRTGAVDWDDFYLVGLESGATYASGGLKIFDNGAWGTRSPDCDMPFQLWGKTATTAQLAEMLAAGQFFALVDVRANSGVEERPFRDGTLTILDEAERLLGVGTSTGGALVATVTAQRAVVVDGDPGQSDLDLLLGRDGRLRHPLTGLVDEGYLPVGQWVRLADLPVADGLLAGVGRFFVEAAEYDVSGGRLRLTPQGSDR